MENHRTRHIHERHVDIGSTGRQTDLAGEVRFRSGDDCADDPQARPSPEPVIVETGPWLVWFYHALQTERLPAICVDARHASSGDPISTLIGPLRPSIAQC